MSAARGAFLGNGYVAGIGRVRIFESHRENFFLVVNGAGRTYFQSRDRVEWRKEGIAA